MQFLNHLLNAVIQVLCLSVIPLIWWFVTAQKEESFFKWIGLKKPIINGSVIRLIFLIIIVTTVYILLLSVVVTQLMGDTDNAAMQFDKQGWSALPSILIYAIIQTGLSEELFFRGFLGKRLINRFGFKVGNTVQALLFGLMHGIPFGLSTRNMMVTLLLTILPGSIGWFQGWMNEKCSAGSIVPSWIMHSIMNFLSMLSSAF
ncbi:MAG: CPBP family intramembrane metalloprotease [Lachnospiraceae bacterium]|jgi:membrane protease YdiL (CAAX protease family)|nr:CPBP family intramembrane metalloprotease [Lachnospiraceae bacterium]